jgi:hypothetical protein
MRAPSAIRRFDAAAAHAAADFRIIRPSWPLLHDLAQARAGFGRASPGKAIRHVTRTLRDEPLGSRLFFRAGALVTSTEREGITNPPPSDERRSP